MGSALRGFRWPGARRIRVSHPSARVARWRSRALSTGWCSAFMFFFSSRRRHTRYWRDWSSDVCSSDLIPPDPLDLSWERHLDREARVAPLLDALAAFGADVVHAHLLDAGEVRRLGASGLPLVLTIHNVREAWPSGTDGLETADAALVVACAGAVEAELRALRRPVPLRTVWNGVDFAALARTPSIETLGGAWRERLGFAPDDLVLVAVANPRAHKRLPPPPRLL